MNARAVLAVLAVALFGFLMFAIAGAVLVCVNL